MSSLMVTLGKGFRWSQTRTGDGARAVTQAWGTEMPELEITLALTASTLVLGSIQPWPQVLSTPPGTL